MKKRMMAILLAFAMILTALTGCSNKEAEYFFQMADEMLALEDVQLTLTMPYHGSRLEVSGFVSKSERKADLLLSLSGTDKNDGPLTELRIDGSQIWLNVRQLAEQTLAFDLHEYYREDIEVFYEEQFADWLIYEADEKLWSGVPGWGELLEQLWTDLKKEIKDDITGEETSAVLELDGEETDQVLMELYGGLLQSQEEYRSGFEAFMQQESEFFQITSLGDGMFDDWASDVTEAYQELNDGTKNSEGAKLTLTKDGQAYTAELALSGGDTWSLQLIPAEAGMVERPYSVIEFEAYGENVFYLVTFANTYIGYVLSGTELDPMLEEMYSAEEVYYREDMTTVAIDGYSDINNIRFVPLNGREMLLPVLSNFLGNSVTTVEDGNPIMTDLTLEGEGWQLQVYSEEQGGMSPQAYLEDKMYTSFDSLIHVSGFQLVHDLSGLQTSANGTAMTEGFSYRSDNYSDTISKITILVIQEQCSSYPQIELTLELDVMTEDSKLAVEHLFEYLGLVCPVDMETD